MGNILQRLIYNLSAMAPLCFIFALLWYWQKKTMDIPCIVMCIGVALVILFMISFSYGKRHLAPIIIRTNDIAPYDSWVAFQRFRKEQYITTNWVNLFFTRDTFRREKNFGISISDTADCYYTEGELQFSSFYFARQIFDLSEYYRSATDQEVQSFTTSDKLSFEDTEAFKNTANTWIRRKIAMINDSGVLVNYKASEIKKLAKDAGITIAVENKKVVIPNDKEQIKVILGFLDEEAYKGPFSQNTFLANSKRRVNK